MPKLHFLIKISAKIYIKDYETILTFCYDPQLIKTFLVDYVLLHTCNIIIIIYIHAWCIRVYKIRIYNTYAI